MHPPATHFSRSRRTSCGHLFPPASYSSRAAICARNLAAWPCWYWARCVGTIRAGFGPRGNRGSPFFMQPPIVAPILERACAQSLDSQRLCGISEPKNRRVRNYRTLRYIAVFREEIPHAQGGVDLWPSPCFSEGDFGLAAKRPLTNTSV